ncbi:class I SAM-dependent RNA methyltransferase [Mycobacterium sp. GA-2829]|uniref:class I SAM-dependent RNA methyltransferase n=1 Tax=Mycobacterium sp. GA-2829 TaxID=1772283 RepID=UPI0007403D93|nr:TRAM domain-containing protein [Mycobacterium sp. GA-2829]KUI20032.1 23S rRNA methyltransferase [Mycobacterium sp. GA-2829]
MTDDVNQNLILQIGPPANGGSCVARHDGRVVFVRHALPGETVRVRVQSDRGSYWHADVVEVLEPSPDRIPSLCPIAGVDGAGCCDLAFVTPEGARSLKGAVVANQLARLGDHRWRDEDEATAEALGDGSATGWRTRVRLDTDDAGVPGLHRYHSADLVTDLRCAQLPDELVAEVDLLRFPPGAHVHVALGDDGARHIVQSGPRAGRRSPPTAVVSGSYEATQRIGQRVWRIPVTAFWQAHRDAARHYSRLVAQWAGLQPGQTAWDLYGGAGVFAATLAEQVGDTGRVLTVDTSRAAGRSARTALADLPQVSVVTDSVRRALTAERQRADVAVLDPPRAGAGREIVDAISAAGVPRVIHIGCEAASFARDVGLYLRAGYTVEEIRVFDSFPLTHHVECVAVLNR